MTIPKKKPGPRSKMPPAKVLYDLYIDHTAAEIAAKYGVSVSTVRGWIRSLRAELASVPAEGGRV